MKKLLLLISILPTMMVAQEVDYNKWSISLDAGANKFFRAFNPGFSTDTPDFITVNAGLRYMINPKIGFMGDIGYSSLENGDSSLEFDNQYYRGSLQIVSNLTNLLDIRNTWWKNAGILFHIGAGISLNNTENPQTDNRDWLGNLIIGVSPQLKLSERLSLKGDISLLGHLSQDLGWEGNSINTGFIDGGLFTTTLGLEIALGKKGKHADWVNSVSDNSEIEALKEKIANIETDLLDSDQDGVADYLDREPSSVSGVTVNTKGITVDNNRNGIPDEFETALDRKYANQAAPVVPVTPTSYEDALKKLLADGYINVYFNTASATPTTFSSDAVNYLITYLNNNPSATGELVGFADKRGSSSYNSNLSTRRAKKVYDLLLDSGISSSRLTYKGNGEEPSGDSKTSLQLRRKVTFKLK